MRSKILFLIISGIIVASMGYFAYAAVQGSSVSEDETGQVTETTAGNDVAQGGNVTSLNLTATVSTDRWQGYFGNVSGDLQLGLGTDIFYDFSAAEALTIFASQDQNFIFLQLNNATAAAVDTVWGFAAGNDQAADAYLNYTNCSNVTYAPTVFLEPTTTPWNSTILSNGTMASKGSFAFGVEFHADYTCFNLETCDYQLMVPADGTETYYFFVEI